MTNQLPTLYQQFIHLSRYARWVDSQKRRELWKETVDRYADYMFDKQCAGKIPKEVRAEIREAILNLEVMPSMRCMMTAGKALEIDNVAGFNCFAGGQKFLTLDGLKTFTETVGTTQMVLNRDGKWTPSEIRCFGKQRLQRVVLKPFGSSSNSKTNLRHVVVVTPNHRWITQRGETTNLRVGDVVPFVGYQGNSLTEAWIRGFGFGDGTLDERGRARVRLCGKKDMQYLPMFEKYGKCSIMYPPSFGGDALVVFWSGVFADWKELPTSKDPDYLSGWVRGYLAADGRQDRRQPGLDSQNDNAIRFVREIAPYAGMHVTGHAVSNVKKTNYGERSAALQRLTHARSGHFRVQSIEMLEEKEFVFCAIEPQTHTFVLDGGILTGNCAYVAIDNISSFDEMLYLLMCGTGVGFSVERQFIAELPVIADRMHPSRTVIKVEDSRVGWADAYRELVSMLYQGRVPEWDVSEVRPAGARLVTFGGRASGPQPLVDLFKFTIETFKQAAGRKLNSIECHDICCKIGEIVVVGGVRRSAEISLSNPSDDRMRYAKSGNWNEVTPWRQMANNSACYTEKPGMDVFFREWMALFESKSGERGIFNRQAAKSQVVKYGRRDPNFHFGTNPCVTDDTWILTSNGPMQVIDLIGKPFGAVVGGEVYECKDGFFHTGEKDVFAIQTDRGYAIKATANHPMLVERWRKIVYKRNGGPKRKVGYERGLEWVDVGSLRVGDKLVLGDNDGFAWGTTGEEELGWLVGEIVGDGGYNPDKYPTYLRFWGPAAKGMADYAVDIIRRRLSSSRQFKGTTYNKENETWQVGCKALDQLCLGLISAASKDILPKLERASSSFVRGFIRGFFDADGCPQGNLAKGRSVRLAQSSREKLMVVQRMLSRIGIVSTITKERRVRTEQLMPDGRGGRKVYVSNPCWELIVARNCLDRFADLIGFADPDKSAGLENLCDSRIKTAYEDTFTTEVTSVSLWSRMKVYDCVVSDIHQFDANGFIVHNCSEIVLRSRQFCNLSEVVIRPGDTQKEIQRKVRIAVILGTMQATLTSFRYLGPMWKKNTEEEALLGVSMTGIMDNELTSGRQGKRELIALLNELRESAVKVNKEWAGKLGINPAAAITCVKPSGCATLDTKIKTDQGVLSFAEIFQMNGVNPIGLHSDMWIEPKCPLKVYDKNNELMLVTKLYVNGMADVYELEDENGHVFRFTGNHELLTTKGWKRVDELTSEDEIVSFQ